MANEVTEQKSQEAPEASTSIISSILSFVLPTAHAEAPEDGDKEEKEHGDGDEEDKDEAEEGGDDEEEEEEPEDIAPEIRENCQNGECAKLAHHFQACQDKVEAGKGWQGEDCVDEMFHMMHCVDACAAPKLFKKLA